MNEHNYTLSFTEYEKIDEENRTLNIYVSGPDVVNKRKMYRYDYIGQLTMMYSARCFGLIQIKDIKKIMTMLYGFSSTKSRIPKPIF